MEIKTKENCSEKLLIRAEGKKKSTKGEANGGQTDASPVPCSTASKTAPATLNFCLHLYF